MAAKRTVRSPSQACATGARAADAAVFAPPATGEAAARLLEGIGSTHVGLCLCDAEDTIRFVNEAFRHIFMPLYRGEPVQFVDALAASMQAGQGIKLETIPLSVFVPRVKARRRTGAARYDFSVDMHDGSWWWVNDHRMADGWTLVVASDMSSIKHEELKLRHAHASAVQAAQTDFLTGLANRRAGFEQAEAAVAAALAAAQPLVVAVVDIDHFKRINDTFGHDVGDKVLVHFAQTLRQELRVRDQVSRIGGEEFLVVMPATAADVGKALLGRLLRAVPPLAIGPRGSVLPISASAGLAAVGAHQSFRETLAAADVALYTAKAMGRDRVEACAA